MLRYIVCGTTIYISYYDQGRINDCPCYGIDLEIVDNSIVAQQLEQSEE